MRSRQFGETRSLTLPTGMGLNVTRELTAAEAAYFIETATGCRPAGLVQSYSTQHNRGMHRLHALDCG